MSYEVAIHFPSFCLGCKSERKQVMDGRAWYACGTLVTENLGKLKVERTRECARLHRERGEIHEVKP